MPKYIDGFVLTVPKKKLDEYKKIAKVAAKVWKKHGALDYKECIGDDMTPEKVAFPFPKMAKAKPDEVVVFSYIIYKSRAHRDRVNAKVMADPAMDIPGYTEKNMPFDMKRLAFGGFEVVVDAQSS